MVVQNQSFYFMMKINLVYVRLFVDSFEINGFYYDEKAIATHLTSVYGSGSGSSIIHSMRLHIIVIVNVKYFMAHSKLLEIISRFNNFFRSSPFDLKTFFSQLKLYCVHDLWIHDVSFMQWGKDAKRERERVDIVVAKGWWINGKPTNQKERIRPTWWQKSQFNCCPPWNRRISFYFSLLHFVSFPSIILL